ncbi:MAG: biotin transporter BioY [bacterium]|nr:biotin transporter BioY [bacterium]
MQKQKKWSVKDMSLCALFSALIAAGAFMKISLPLQPFPMHFTLQWFFVLLAGFLLGPRLGSLSVCIYLAIGLVGVPIFAAGGGPAYLIRPTFGFLLGFALAAYAIGYVSRRIQASTFPQYLLAGIVGLIVMYLSGMIYFYIISNYVISMPVTWKIVFINCFLVTVGGDFVLCVLASALAKRLRNTLRYL